MLRRTPFKTKPKLFERPERAPLPASRPVRQVAPTVFSELVKISPKSKPVRNEEYRRLVAGMPCKVCGIAGHSQAAHPNTGKGTGFKTDDRLCFPLCCDRPGVQGCHPKFDQGAMYSQGTRRVLELVFTADTQRAIQARGLWPKNLPLPESHP